MMGAAWMSVLKHLILLCVWYFVSSNVFYAVGVAAVIYVVRKFESFVYYLLYDATPMSADDRFWVLPSSPRLINALMVMEGAVDLDKFRKLLIEKLVTKCDVNGNRVYPSISRRTQAGLLGYYWIKNDHFDISRHVYMATDTPVRTEDELMQLVSEICSKPLSTVADDNNNTSSPRWQFLLIPMVTEDGNVKTNLLVRLDHIIADGSSLAYFLVNDLADSQLDKQTLNKITTFTQKQNVMSLVKAVWNMPLVLGKNMLMKRDNNILYSYNPSLISTFAYSKPIPMHIVKSIKNRLKCTINDVLLGCLSKTLHDYFVEHDVEDTTRKRFTVHCAVDSRKSLPQGMTNKVTTLILALPTTQGDTVECVNQAHSMIQTIKNNHEALGIYLSWQLISFIFPRFLLRTIALATLDLATGSVSNLIGPNEPIRIQGHRVDKITYWQPKVCNHTFTASFCSYNDEVRVGFQADVGILKNLDEFGAGFERIVNDLLNSIKV